MPEHKKKYLDISEEQIKKNYEEQGIPFDILEHRKLQQEHAQHYREEKRKQDEREDAIINQEGKRQKEEIEDYYARQERKKENLERKKHLFEQLKRRLEHHE